MIDQIPEPIDRSASPSWIKASSSTLEQKNWENESVLRGQKTTNDLRWLKAYGWCVVFLLCVAFIILIAAMSVLAIYYLCPINYCVSWWESEQIQKIEALLFHSSIGAILSLIAQKQLSK